MEKTLKPSLIWGCLFTILLAACGGGGGGSATATGGTPANPVQTLPTAASLSQQAYIKSSDFEAGQDFCRVALSGDTLVVGAPYKANGGGVYVFTRTGDVWTQQAYLTGSNADPDDFFGYSVAIDGDTIVVGAQYDDGPGNADPDTGAVYVFTRSGGAWSEQAYLRSSTPEAWSGFGKNVSISGDTLVTGQPTGTMESVYVFTRTGAAWSEQAALTGSNTQAGDAFGNTIFISGDTLVVGAPYEDALDDFTADDSGAVYVFTRTGSAWTEQAIVRAPNAQEFDNFGMKVVLSGDTLAVSAPYEDGPDDGTLDDSGAVYIFTGGGSSWAHQTTLKASNAGAGDILGRAFSFAGDILVVGTYFEDSNATGIGGNEANEDAIDSGAVYVFTRTGDAWSQAAYMKASNADAGDCFGYRTAISGNTIAVGAQFEASNATGINGNQLDNTAASGAVYVFTW